ncbi:uncharacterized protein LOC132644117 [Lycium barbarum]|uniref:uncharacterized protein LOC132644117 n=1 Tax=Lycium barbarum TaxID=112863 RepID=UPI00293EC32C|nr:uncharacterized protein LOC132644117 [Lycium barbarum]
MTWWNADVMHRIKSVYNAIPSVIVWELWKKRNCDMHRNKVTNDLWEFPPAEWLKCNTDRATRGNPGRSSYAYCVRNATGDLLHAQAKEMEESTNTESEAQAFLQAARYCLSIHVYSFILETDSLLLKNILG